LSAGDNVVVYTIHSLFGLIFARGKIATLATVVRIIEGKGTVMAEVRGDMRVRIVSRRRFRSAHCREIPVTLPGDHEARSERLRKKAQEFVFLINIPESDRLIYLVSFIQGLHDVTDFIAHYFIVDHQKKKALYALTDVSDRSLALEHYLDAMISDLRWITEKGADENNSRR
jgi:ATP-dependent Lon protease